MSIDFDKIFNYVQPLYDDLNSNYSKSYLQGSPWYVGDSLKEWWRRCNNVRYFFKNKQKLVEIIETLCIYENNKKR